MKYQLSKKRFAHCVPRCVASAGFGRGASGSAPVEAALERLNVRGLVPATAPAPMATISTRGHVR